MFVTFLVLRIKMMIAFDGENYLIDCFLILANYLYIFMELTIYDQLYIYHCLPNWEF